MPTSSTVYSNTNESPSYPQSLLPCRSFLYQEVDKHASSHPSGPPDTPDNDLGPQPIDLPAERCLSHGVTQVDTPYITYRPYHYWWGQKLQYEGRDVFTSIGGENILIVNRG